MRAIRRLPRSTAGSSPAPELLDEYDGETVSEPDTDIRGGGPDLGPDPVFRLQQLERSLVRACLRAPGVLSDDELRRMRYLISFARLTRFEPGAALGERGRGDVDVSAQLESWRALVVDALARPLRREPDPTRKLEIAVQMFRELEPVQGRLRLALAAAHADEFTLEELDAEVGLRKVVLVLGGGGGAGYVYAGAMKALVEADLAPAYVLGGSMGAIIGGLLAREDPPAVESTIEFGRSMSYRGLLGAEPPRRHGIASIFGLKYADRADELFRRPDGERMRMDDMPIPFDTVVSGVLTEPFRKLPARFRSTEAARIDLRRLPRTPRGIGPVLTARLFQVASFMNTKMVKPLVIGGDDVTGQFDVVDAQGFSAAIPGVLHHETSSERMAGLLDEWMASKGVAALIDGVATANVPIELAWRRLQDGRIGTRNGVVLALDCMHPQWDPKHLWLAPITRAVAVQMVRNAPFADHLLRMRPTLSVATIAPSPEALDRAVTWGEASIERALLLLRALTEPVWWDQPLG